AAREEGRGEVGAPAPALAEGRRAEVLRASDLARAHGLEDNGENAIARGRADGRDVEREPEPRRAGAHEPGERRRRALADLVDALGLVLADGPRGVDL